MTALPRLPKNCTHTLHVAGIHTLEDCASWPKEEVGKLRHVGPKMLNILDVCVREIGLDFDATSPKRAESINALIAAERSSEI